MEQVFIDKLMEVAKSAGIETAEAYIVEKESFSAIQNAGELVDYKSNVTQGLGFRGLVKGRMGYASTEAFDSNAVYQLVNGVLESAELCEDTDEEFIYFGGDEPPEVKLYDPELDKVTADAKLALIDELDKRVKAYDPRIENGYSGMETAAHTIRIVNTCGLDRSFTENMCGLFAEPNAKEGTFVSSGSYQQLARSFSGLSAKTVAEVSAARAIGGLNAASVPSGRYRVVFHNEVMTSLLGVFCTVFSAETAQKGLSLLTGKLNQTVAAPCVTLIDDPLLENAMGSRPFDAEGVASARHTLIDAGVFTTFLHNMKTANKDGVETTANAGKAGYASAIHVAPSNLFFEKGTQDFETLLRDMGDGLVITEVSGLHAGANAVSGDFSLLSKGYTVKNGQREKPVEQITVAGNYYELLKNIVAMGSDLCFPDGAVGSPSAYIGELSVSGS